MLRLAPTYRFDMYEVVWLNTIYILWHFRFSDARKYPLTKPFIGIFLLKGARYFAFSHFGPLFHNSDLWLNGGLCTPL